MENDQTPNVNITPDPESPEAKYFETTETEADNTEGTEVTENTPTEPEVNYKEKFAASTRENQRIEAEKKVIQDALNEKEANIVALAEEKAEYERRLKDEQPETYDAIKVNKELSELKKDLVLEKEGRKLNDYIESNPDAKGHKEALKGLGRVNPNMSYDNIYQTMVKPIYEAGIKDYETKKQLKKQIQPETGRGSVEKAPNIDTKEFNSGSLEERRRQFKEMGL